MPKPTCHNLMLMMVLGTAASGAWAQSAQMDGRRLDNSLQQGSSGFNAPAAQPDYRMRNNLITGNVSGLSYFHGSVGYRAPGEFQGRTSSDSLFRFQSQSLLPTGISSLGFGAPNLHNAPSLAIQQSPVTSLYRGIAPTSVADLMAGNRMNTNVLSSGLTVRSPAMGYTGTGVDTLRNTPIDRLGVSFQSVQDGRLLDMTATPLLGVRRVEAGDLQRLFESPLQGTTSPRFSPPLPAAPGTSPGEAIPSSGASLREFAQVPAQRVDASTTTLATHESLRDRPSWTPSLALGATLMARLNTPRVDEQVSLDQQIERLQAQLFSPLGSHEIQPGQDVYMDILRRVRDNTLRSTGKPVQPEASQPSSSPLQPSTTVIPGRGPGYLPPEMSEDAASRYDLAIQQQALRGPLTREQLDQARLQREQAMARARGLRLPSAESPNPDLTNDTPALRGVIPAEPEKTLPESLTELINSLQKTGPALTSLAASRNDLLNNLLRAAEDDLANGRYFESEGRYRAVLDLDASHPLARVGQVHAQMAAGMVFSATLNLRRWLEDHPELIGVRYQANLLPPAQRLDFIRQQLDEMIRSGKRTEPPLLLAYLGYQFSLPEVTRYALDVAQARSPLDPLLPLIRRVWLTSPDPQP